MIPDQSLLAIMTYNGLKMTSLFGFLRIEIHYKVRTRHAYAAVFNIQRSCVYCVRSTFKKAYPINPGTRETAHANLGTDPNQTF